MEHLTKEEGQTLGIATMCWHKKKGGGESMSQIGCSEATHRLTSKRAIPKSWTLHQPPHLRQHVQYPTKIIAKYCSIR